MRNFEFKARIQDPKPLLAGALELGFELWGDLRQTDTYFDVAHGRLKLRETPAFPAELIYYERDEDAADRPSDYAIARSADGAALSDVLRQALGVSAVVRKRRTLLLLDTLRIHLDNVEGLGSFLEIEVPVGAEDEEAHQRQRLEALLQALGFSWGDYPGFLRRLNDGAAVAG